MNDPSEELDKLDEYDDDINEAIYDATCDCEGRASARYLRFHLAKRGLKIVAKDPL